MEVAQHRDRCREVRVAASPVVHDLRATHTKTAGDLAGAYEIVAVHEPAHPATLRPKPDRLRIFCRTRIVVRSF